MFNTIVLKKENDVAIVTLSRPGRLNALSVELLEELTKVMEEMESCDDIKSVVITGGEKVFCAGADVNMFPGLSSADQAYDFVEKFKYALASLKRLSKPVIAAVCGYALGGGMELSLHCDMRIAAEDAMFGLPEVNIGAFPAAGGTQILPRIIGVALAKEMLLVGDPISGAEAYRVGMVNKVYPKKDVLNEALKLAKNLAKKPAYAVKTIKRLVDNGIEMDLSRALTYESSSFVGIWASDDFKEGYTAFLEKRKPVFNGR